MLKQIEYTCKNGVKQIKSYSDKGFYIRQVETNLLYSEAYDNIPLKYNYEETDKIIEVVENDN